MFAPPTEEQRALIETVRHFCTKHSPESEVRRLMATERGFDKKVWRDFASIGVVGLAVPEKFGGSDAGWTEVGLVLEECGRALLCAPYFSTAVVSTAILLHCGDDQACLDLLPTLASGERTAATAAALEPGSPTTVRAAAREGGWRLDGSVGHVLDGASADLILVLAQADDGPSLFAVEADVAGVERAPVPTMDQTRKLANLTFTGAEARLLGPVGGAESVLEEVRDIAAVCLAAEQLGGAQRILEMAVEYAKSRFQFGRPIGGFQAVKHMCADMLVEIELARSTMLHGLSAADEKPGELAVAACLASITCSETYSFVAKQNVQVHGGIGFTWEHPAHLYLKRAKSSQLLLGDPVAQVSLLADRIML